MATVQANASNKMISHQK